MKSVNRALVYFVVAVLTFGLSVSSSWLLQRSLSRDQRSAILPLALKSQIPCDETRTSEEFGAFWPSFATRWLTKIRFSCSQ